ncbi:MAG TPA: MFS transporter, partial [Ilumatobacteraceae bacterium]
IYRSIENTQLLMTSLGRSYRQLLLAATVSRCGDGVFLSTLPLLALSITASPLAVAAVQFSLTLPWLLFGLVSGALADRWDRRAIMWRTDVCRFAITTALVITITAGALSIPVLAGFGFALGITETLFDSAALSILPMLVGTEPRQLTRANAGLDASGGVAAGFVGPAAGAALYAVARLVPAVANAISFIASAALLRTLPRQPPRRDDRRGSLRSDIREGMRWLGAQPLLRRLAVAVGVINLATTAGTTVLVLYLRQTVSAGVISYAVVLICAATGGLIANIIVQRRPATLERRCAMPLAVALIATGLVAAGATPHTAVTAVAYAVIGLAGAAWNVATVSARQRLVPPDILGRVNSAYRLIAFGTIPLGALAGGTIAHRWGLRAPFLAGGALLALTAAALHKRQAGERGGKTC